MKNTLKLAILVVLFSASLVAFGAKKPEGAEYVLVNAPLNIIRSGVILDGATLGWKLESESPSQVVLVHPNTGAGGALTTIFLTPPACTDFTPRFIRTVTFAEQADHTVGVIVTDENEHASAFCKPARDTMTGKNIRQRQAEYLQALKAYAEKQARISSPIQAAPAQPAPAAAPVAQVTENQEAAKTSPAAAAALANAPAPIPQELAQLVQNGRASRCAVVTNPAGAEVYIDGNKAGLSPLAFVLVKRDNPRTITVEMPGYKTVEKAFVPDGKTIPISLALEKQ